MIKSEEETKKTSLLSALKDNKLFCLLRHGIAKAYVDALKGVDIIYALEIDSDNLRLVKARKKDKRILQITTDTELVKGLSKSISTLFLTQHYNGEETLINITGIDFLNKIVELDLEQNQTVQDWIIKNKDRLFPLTGDKEIEFDYVVLRDNNRKFMYLSIVRQDGLQQLQQIFRENHLNVSSLSSGSLSLYSFLKKYEEIVKVDKLAGILLKDKSAEITFLNKGVPIFVTVTSLADQKGELVAKIKSLMQFHYHNSERMGDWKFLLLGEENAVLSYERTFRDAGLTLLEKNWLQKYLNQYSIPTSHLSPFALINEPDGAASERITNFLPSHNRLNDSAKTIAKTFSYTFKIFLLFLVVFGVFNLGFIIFDSLNQSRVKNFESKIEVLDDLKQENQMLEDQWGKLGQMFLNRSTKSRLLYLVSKYCPEGIWLRNITSEGSSSSEGTEIAGLSVSQAEITNFLENLEESNFFDNIKLLYSDKVETAELTKLPAKYKSTLYKFKIQFQSKL